MSETPISPDLAVRAILDGRDTDRIAELVHTLLAEIADLNVRVNRLEAQLAGQEADDDPATIQRLAGEVVARVVR
ncbi:MAG: hypothetical protein AAF414_23065 [Pseudomonadota bacterium]